MLRLLGFSYTRALLAPRLTRPARLEELNEQRTSQVARLKLVERDREGLDGAKAEAEAFIEKEAKLLRSRATLFQLFLGEAQTNVAKIEANKGELEAKLAHERCGFRTAGVALESGLTRHAPCLRSEKHAEHTASLASTEAAHRAAAAEHETLSGVLEAATKDFREYERKDIKMREDIKHAKGKAKKLDEKLAADGAKRAELEARAASDAAAVPGLEAKREAAEAALGAEEAKLDALLRGLRGELEGLGSQLSAVEGDLAPWEARIAEAQARCDVARAERDLLAGKAEAAAKRAADARAGAAAADAEAAAADSEAGRLQKELATQTAAAASAARDGEAARKAEAEARVTLSASRGRMEERRAAAADFASRGTLLKALLAAKASGAIPGILGRLGDLGAIDAKYDVAVSTAGPGLDHIVVETTEDAQRCVELLRKSSLGVATFLILERQKGLEAEAGAPPPAAVPEGAQRLLDLVRPAEPRLRVAFFYALRHTLVAADMDAASRIAYGAATPAAFKRVVTLEGQLIESSGTMAGGGAKPRGGRMRVGTAAPRAPSGGEGADAEASAKAAAAEWEAASAAQAKAAAAAESATQRAAAAEAAVAQLQRTLPKLTLQAASLRAKAVDLRSQLAALDAAASPSAEDAARLAAVRKELDAAVFALSEVKAGAAGLHAKAQQLRKAMEDAGGMPLRAARASVARLQKEIEDAGADAAARRATAAASAKSAAKLAEALDKASAERGVLAGELASKKAEFATLEARALEVLEAANGTKAALEAKASELAALKATHDDAAKAVGLIRGVEVDIAAKLEDLARDAKDNGDKAKHWDKKLAAVRKEIADAAGTPDQLPPLLTEEQLAAQTSEDALEEVTLLEAELATARPDMSAIAAWRKKEDEYCRRAEELRALTESRDAVRAAHDALRKRRLEEFMAGFNAISLKLKEMYQMITLGGDAELELVDSLDPFSEGIVFSVRPPKKSWKNIANLSGGEKTLSSLALVFALHHYKPTPLYVMDEIDAALDFKNVSIVAHYIKERTRDAQFIIISLRNNMFELADRLVGIYKTDDCTKSVTINPGAFAVGPGAVPPAARPKALAAAAEPLAAHVPVA